MENEKIEVSAEEKMQEATQKLCELAKEICEKLQPIFEKAIPVINEFVKTIYDTIAPAFTNKKAIHLARHSKKARVRKKNAHRIIKSIQRGLTI